MLVCTVLYVMYRDAGQGNPAVASPKRWRMLELRGCCEARRIAQRVARRAECTIPHSKSAPDGCGHTVR